MPVCRWSRRLALLAGLLSLLSACGHKTYVKVDDAALGRVVVYRNGVAYYERRASLAGDTLDLKVPADRVDDFLKSLTVADAKTGQPLPVSFPNRASLTGGGDVSMTVKVPPAPGQAPRDVVLTYVTESPAWKSSYRVVIDETGKVMLEGWAIVDNTSAEDWNLIKVGVGSSSALAFRYDLHGIRLVHRDILQSQDRFAVAPPVGGSTYRTDGGSGAQVIEQLAAADLPRDNPPPPPVTFSAPVAAVPAPESAPSRRPPPGRAAAKGKRETSAPGRMAAAEDFGGVGGSVNRGPVGKAMGAGNVPQPTQPADGGEPARRAREQARMKALVESLRRRGGTVTIEGYADAGEVDPQARSAERAHALRNQLIKEGVPPAQLQVAARGVVAGQKGGVRLVSEPQPAATKDDAKSGGTGRDGEPVGESHFESTTPMSVPRGTSAMVAIFKEKAPGEIVYLYDPEADRGDRRFAFRSVRFRNPTSSTLESGPVTVYGQARFVGEGLADAIPPHAIAVVPFALDRQVVIERDASEGDRIAKLVTLQRGILTCEMQHRRTTKLRMTNRLQETTTLLVRHTTSPGWVLGKAPSDSEQYGTSRLYRVKLAAGETRSLEIEETTPLQKTLDLRSPDGLTMVEAYLKGSDRTPALAEKLAKLLKLQREMADAEEAIISLRQRGEEYRLRMDELHAQIVTLGTTKTGGPLTAHLQAKMKEISERVQQNTLAVVQKQEQLMLARVSFQDTLAELTLGNSSSVAARD
jgi:hypothetical protein